MDERVTPSPLYFQLHVFTGCRDHAAIAALVAASGIDAVVYESLNDPLGAGILFVCRSPAELLDTVAPLLRSPGFQAMQRIPSLTMIGRTYLIGYEQDAAEALIHRPRSRALDPALKWAIWYPLRRSGTFERISADEQRQAMRDHGAVGAQFAKDGAAHDIRLACHGLDSEDNDFVIGIAGPELTPLSALVERMRKTIQTSMYLQKLGPFFVGRVYWQARAD